MYQSVPERANQRGGFGNPPKPRPSTLSAWASGRGVSAKGNWRAGPRAIPSKLLWRPGSEPRPWLTVEWIARRLVHRHTRPVGAPAILARTWPPATTTGIGSTCPDMTLSLTDTFSRLLEAAGDLRLELLQCILTQGQPAPIPSADGLAFCHRQGLPVVVSLLELGLSGHRQKLRQGPVLNQQRYPPQPRRPCG